MPTETTNTIDHAHLRALAAKTHLPRITLTGHADGWIIVVRDGKSEKVLLAQRSGASRQFRKVDTAVNYLKSLGFEAFNVDAKSFDPTLVPAARQRPDRAIALKNAHEAAEREAYFLEEMTKRVAYADSPDAVWIPHAEFLKRWEVKKAAFLARPR
jgi:hypothetical protein